MNLDLESPIVIRTYDELRQQRHLARTQTRNLRVAFYKAHSALLMSMHKTGLSAAFATASLSASAWVHANIPLPYANIASSLCFVLGSYAVKLGLFDFRRDFTKLLKQNRDLKKEIQRLQKVARALGRPLYSFAQCEEEGLGNVPLPSDDRRGYRWLFGIPRL